MEKRIITVNDYERLMGAIELASIKERMTAVVTNLHTELTNAKIIPQDAISGDVVTMNSRILLKEIVTERKAELTIAYPEGADSLGMKISVFSPVGVAVLGRQCGDIVSWKTPLGIGRFEILEVTYQPEAVGHYAL